MAQKTWQVQVASKGTAVQGPDTGPGVFMLQAGPGNTGTYAYFGNDGADDVDSAHGYTLAKGQNQAQVVTNNMNNFWFDVDTDGDKIEILKEQGLSTTVPSE